VQFLQSAPPTRSDVPAYQLLRNQLAGMAGDINARWVDADLDADPLRQ